jgi:hypothetical protein
MPTIHRQDGFAVMVYTDDHLPAHVHVWKAGGEVVINLDDASIREINDMGRRDVRRAVEVVKANQELFRRRWRGIHG